MKRISFFAVIVVVALFFAGCASTSSGTKMSSADVNQIVKGKTTRAEVEKMFGPPTQVAMTGNDERLMIYSYNSTTAQTKPENFIPFVNMFTGGARGKTEMQTLYVRLDKDNIVKDYEFNNNASALNYTEGFGTFKTSSTPVAPETSVEAKK